MRVSVVGIVFLASLVITGWIALAYVLTPSLLLVVLPFPKYLQTKHFYRRVTHFIQWAWMGQVVLLLENFFGVQVQIFGDHETKIQERHMLRDRAIWLCNHRTRIDWMLLWSVAWRTRTLQILRIVLKAPLRKIPIFGWAMQHFIFIFLQRHWADDQVNLRKLLPFFSSLEPETSYLIFPEGTDLSECNLEKSAIFAKRNGLLPRQFSLYPRTTGWTFMFPLLSSQLTAVYDITMFYVDYALNERPSEASLLSGRMPRMIHFYIERVDISVLRDNSESEMATWLENRFERKESLLKAFYQENGKLPDNAQRLFEQTNSSASAAVILFWLGLLTATTICGVYGKSISVIAAVTIAAGYTVYTAFGSGVDGFLVENLK
ncbi:lysocardiolipin acyltransferase [Plasmopara halstedii]|uniref:Lysocardiolipin acyltransferase n=1 Tax=Plasmopara halstedii TaxID=4781 RepID=A0A0P1ANB6_PLAHL|nr:lysocardiolipin acyltransferase [Plasmopara halstedii]CEG42495.1 lysocardiolipin acyltransferase [Plasmopara halstedii]|eukprot:XP_024578864.1 lysocardiolipin acyltransferase [Plasmopara halstedii]